MVDYIFRIVNYLISFVQFVDLEGPKTLLASDRFMADTVCNYVSPLAGAMEFLLL